MYHRVLMVPGQSPNQLQTITIRGFRSIGAIEDLALRPLNVLIGPNGSGKSNFLAAFDFLRSVRDGKLQNSVTAAGGAERILHLGSKHTTQVAFKLSFRDAAQGYELVLDRSSDDGLYPVQEVATFAGEIWPGPHSQTLRPAGEGREAGISGSKDGIGKHVWQDLGTWRRYHFHDTSTTSPMRRRSSLHDNLALREDGGNLAAVLYFLKRFHESKYEAIRGAVKQIAPFFHDFRLEPMSLDPSSVHLEWVHSSSDAYFDATSLSDGTLRFVALATLFVQPIGPRVILVDEPELGLHPSAITLLAALMRQASRHSQVIVATQSSLLLDHCEPEDVLVAGLRNGGTELTRLRSEPLEEWLQEYSLGQLWEKNEIGGRPAAE